MCSPLGVTRCEMALRGVGGETADELEGAASVALSRRHNVHFLTTLAVISAIIQLGSNLATVLGGTASSKAADSLSKNIEALTNQLYPHLEEETRKRAEEVKKQLMAEYEKGPIQVQAMQEPRKSRGKVRVGGAKHGPRRSG